MSKFKMIMFLVAVAAVLLLSTGTVNAAEKAIPEATQLTPPLTNWNCASIPHPLSYKCTGNKGCTGYIRTWSSCTMNCYVGDTSATVVCTKVWLAIPDVPKDDSAL